MQLFLLHFRQVRHQLLLLLRGLRTFARAALNDAGEVVTDLDHDNNAMSPFVILSIEAPSGKTVKVEVIINSNSL